MSPVLAVGQPVAPNYSPISWPGAGVICKLRMVLWDFPWKTFVLLPRFMASESHILKSLFRRLYRKTGRTHLCCFDAANPDSLPREVLKSLKNSDIVH